MSDIDNQTIKVIIENQEKKHCLCHYTTVETLHNLIQGIKNDNFYFYASSIYALNDPEEMYYGYDTFWKWLPSIEKELNLDDNHLLSNIWKRFGKGHSDKYYNRIVKENLYECDKTPFVMSLSNKVDNLNMYRLYSNNATGVCLCFNEYNLKQLNMNIQNVIYGDKIDTTIYRVLKNLLGDIQKKNWEKMEFNDLYHYMVSYFMSLSPIIKRKEYEEEDEWRLFKFAGKNDDIKFRTNCLGNIIPYIKIEIPVKYLDKIIVGPCADFLSTHKILSMELASTGYDFKDRLEKSECSFRIY